MANTIKIDWVEARIKYEAGETQKAIAEMFGVSRAAVQKHIEAEGWTQDLSKSIRQQAQAKVFGVTEPRDAEKTAKAISEYGQKIADLIEGFKKEWSVVGSFWGDALKTAQQDPDLGFTKLKVTKISAEILTMKQAGERRAWRIDEMEKQESVVQQTVNSTNHITVKKDVRNWAELRELKRMAMDDAVRRQNGENPYAERESDGADLISDDVVVEGAVNGEEISI